MTAPTIGSLCTGFGGLDKAAEQVTGGRTVWHCEYDTAPSLLLAHHHPALTNLGDLKALAWADHPVDVVTAGYPCQPFSGAGKRLGTDDPRHLFPWIAQGLERMRPGLLLLENVRGHLSLGFDVVLAELDRVGYDVRWTLLRAADVGAPHGRSRLWIAARDRDAGGWPAPPGGAWARLAAEVWSRDGDDLFGARPLPLNRKGSVAMPTAGALVDGRAWLLPPAPMSYAPGRLLPTPAVNDMGAGKTVEEWDAWTAVQKAKHGNGNGHGPSLSIEVARYGDALGPYADAVARWATLTRPAPRPTESADRGPRVAPAFVEWMQGLPAGWVTDVPGLSRNDQLKLLGNGVVSQCAAAAYALLGVAQALPAEAAA